MAAESGRTSAAVIERMCRDGHRFDFFQAVRLLERASRAGAAGEEPAMHPVGRDYHPHQEAVRFRSVNSLAFPPTPIVAIRPAGKTNGTRTAPPSPARPPAGEEGSEDSPSIAANGAAGAPVEMTVAFMGLTGIAGVLPRHYTTMLIEQARDRETATRDFFDLFNHRIISLFYRATEKYCAPLTHERTRSTKRQADEPFRRMVRSLVGLGQPALRDRMEVTDDAFLHHAGHFAHQPRNAAGLARLLQAYFEVPVRIEQFCGQWLELDPADRSRFPSRAEGNIGRRWNNRLGEGTTLGSAVWDVQSKFRIVLGPLDYQQFRRFTPMGGGLASLCEITRLYVGMEFDFDTQPRLRAGEQPMCRLGGDPENGPRLGWTTWLQSRPQDESEEDFSGAVFVMRNI